MFGRVQIFCTHNGSDFAEGSRCQGCAAKLTKVITDLDTAKVAQAAAAATAKEVLLDALRLDVQNVTRTASASAQDEPGFAESFRPPASDSHGDLLTATDAILSKLLVTPGDSEPVRAAKNALAAKFIAHELSVDFVKDLATDRAAVLAAQVLEDTVGNDSVASTAAIGRLIRAGMKEINYLDAIIHNKYARNPDKLRAWESASHTERAPQREKPPVTNVVNVTPDGPQSKVA